jgi:uroporphyrinogen III methyltransferase/synthase
VKQENAVLGHLTAPLPTVESPRARLGSVPATTTERQPSWSAVGSVVFVGGGPTGPDLLTVRGAQALARARVLFVDDPADAALFAPGASAVVHTLPPAPLLPPARRPRRGGAGDDSLVASRPEAVADAVVRALRPEVGVGCREVVRLVRGDVLTTPGVAAEIAACRRRGIVVDVVPGVPEATAWPAFAGADLAGATGLEAVIVDVRTPSGVPTDGLRPVRSGTGPLSDAEAGSLAAARTAVVLGSQAVMAPVIAQLAALDGGRSAIITVDPGLQTQRSTRGTLTELSVLGEMVEAAAGPRAAGETAAVPGSGGSRTAVLVVGAGAEADMLPADPDPWFEGRPLFGWKVLVPRTKEQAGTLSEALRSYGALPVEVPTIAVEAPRAPQQVEKAVRGLVEGRFEWLVFTSVNALRAIRDKIVEYGLDARALSGLKIATVGEKTAAALRDWGIEPDLVPTGEQSGAGLLAEFPPYDRVLDPIDRVLLPRADIATELLVSGLVELGWQVEDVTAYRTVRAAPPPAEVREAIKTGAFDAVVFTSSSTVRNLVGIAGKPHPTTVVACIGPQTVATATEHGLRASVVAPTPSVDDLAAALAAFALERRTALVAAGEPVRTPAQSRPARGAARRAGS